MHRSYTCLTEYMPLGAATTMRHWHQLNASASSCSGRRTGSRSLSPPSPSAWVRTTLVGCPPSAPRIDANQCWIRSIITTRHATLAPCPKTITRLKQWSPAHLILRPNAVIFRFWIQIQIQILDPDSDAVLNMLQITASVDKHQ